MKIIKIIIIILNIIFISNYLLCKNEFFFKPIKKAYIYDNFYNDLYPFMYSKNILILDEYATLKLLEEIEYNNGFYKDILKVEIIEGNHKGAIGYILEDDVTICFESIKKNASLFFKDDVVLDNKIKIEKKTKCRILSSKIQSEKESLTLQITNDPMLKDFIFEYSDKDKLHFIIDKKGEILYFLHKGFIVIKLIDQENLMQIENAEYNKEKSDEYGILYINNEKNLNHFIIKKEGYSDGIIIKNKNDENIFLCFMQKLKYIHYFNDGKTICVKGQYQLDIINKNISDNKLIRFKTLSLDDYSFFCYPLFDKKNFSIKGGFYINNIPLNSDIQCKILSKDPDNKLYYFNNNNFEWESIPFFKTENNILYNISNDGYYLVIKENDIKYNEVIFLNKNRCISSNIFIRNKNGDICITGSGYKSDNLEKKVTIPDDKYEAVLFSPDFPNMIVQENFNTELNNIIELCYFNNEDKLTSNKFNMELYGLESSYNGKWTKKAVQKNNYFIKKIDDNILEYLGDMQFISPDKICFSTKDYIIEGYLDLINEKKAYINITYISGTIHNDIDSQDYIINPSLFNSKLIIPIIYTYYAGVLEISFDMIYFNRKKLYNKKDDQYAIKMESYTFLNPEFPKSEKECIYKIFFTLEE